MDERFGGEASFAFGEVEKEAYLAADRRGGVDRV
jgi:hypothetical protein